MNAENIEWIGHLIDLGLFIWLGRITWHIAQLTIKVDTMWKSTLRRGRAESTMQGFGEYNSPYRTTERGYALFSPSLSQDLQSFYQDKGHKMDDVTLVSEIERLFGDRITHEVCIPNKLHHFVCLAVACDVAKNNGHPPPKENENVE